jgi:hypothetical protein
MWLATGLNTVVFIRGIRLNKRLEVERKYCLTMIKACTEFLDAEGVEVDLTEEDPDGRND